MKTCKSEYMNFIFRGCLVIFLTFASAGPAYSGIFVDWDGIPGDSEDSNYNDQIEITSISGDFRALTCGGFYIEKALDSSSALLIRAAFLTVITPKVVITLTNEGKKGQEKYYSIELSDVTVQAVSTYAVDGDRPIEEVQLGAELAIFQQFDPNSSDPNSPIKTVPINCSGMSS